MIGKKNQSGGRKVVGESTIVAHIGHKKWAGHCWPCPMGCVVYASESGALITAANTEAAVYRSP